MRGITTIRKARSLGAFLPRGPPLSSAAVLNRVGVRAGGGKSARPMGRRAWKSGPASRALLL